MGSWFGLLNRRLATLVLKKFIKLVAASFLLNALADDALFELLIRCSALSKNF